MQLRTDQVFQVLTLCSRDQNNLSYQTIETESLNDQNLQLNVPASVFIQTTFQVLNGPGCN